MKNELKVSFYLKKNEMDDEGKCPVMGHIRIGKTEAPFSVKRKVLLSLWDTHCGRALGKSKIATDLNRRLDRMNVSIHANYKELSKINDRVSAEQVRVAFLGIVSRKDTLVAYFSAYLENYEQRIGKDREENTLKGLKNSLNHLRQFIKKKYKITDISFTALNYSFIEDYDYHLRIGLRMASCTVKEKVSHMRRMVKYAISEGKITKDPFGGYTAKKSVAKRKYLTAEELHKIMNARLNNSSLCLTRDVFLFACFTGLAYTDVRNLTKQNIVKAEDGIMWIKTSRQKTGVACNIPLLDIPLKIIEKYQGLDKTGKLLVVGSNSGINTNLKKIAAICELNRNLTYHMGRHTYASEITLSQGVPIESVSKMLGHSSISSTNGYAKITNDSIRENVAALELKLENKYQLIQIEKTL
ncbi:MAG: site-specific integrase [Candidatus Symbiothrix sp.]|jgi:site-specific recombinase XerD|nr:site-specific integrase [Candidatus Symbiothrix sp.]